MTELTQQQRIDRLGGPFMNWWHDPDGTWWKGHKIVAPACWNPFTSLDDARLLLLECKRRGLLQKIEWEINAEYVEKGTGGLSLLNTATQQTEAVWVAAGLGET